MYCNKFGSGATGVTSPNLSQLSADTATYCNKFRGGPAPCSNLSQLVADTAINCDKSGVQVGVSGGSTGLMSKTLAALSRRNLGQTSSLKRTAGSSEKMRSRVRPAA